MMNFIEHDTYNTVCTESYQHHKTILESTWEKMTFSTPRTTNDKSFPPEILFDYFIF